MSPVVTQVNANAIQPLSRGEITQEEAFNAGVAPVEPLCWSRLTLRT